MTNIDPNCQKVLQDFVAGKLRYVIVNLSADNKTFLSDKTGATEKTYSDFLKDLPTSECRIGFFNYDVMSKGIPKKLPLVIAWKPSETSDVKKKCIDSAKPIILDRFKRVKYFDDVTKIGDIEEKTLLNNLRKRPAPSITDDRETKKAKIEVNIPSTPSNLSIPSIPLTPSSAKAAIVLTKSPEKIKSPRSSFISFSSTNVSVHTETSEDKGDPRKAIDRLKTEILTNSKQGKPIIPSLKNLLEKFKVSRLNKSASIEDSFETSTVLDIVNALPLDKGREKFFATEASKFETSELLKQIFQLRISVYTGAYTVDRPLDLENFSAKHMAAQAKVLFFLDEEQAAYEAASVLAKAEALSTSKIKGIDGKEENLYSADIQQQLKNEKASIKFLLDSEGYMKWSTRFSLNFLTWKQEGKDKLTITITPSTGDQKVYSLIKQGTLNYKPVIEVVPIEKNKPLSNTQRTYLRPEEDKELEHPNWLSSEPDPVQALALRLTEIRKSIIEKDVNALASSLASYDNKFQISQESTLVLAQAIVGRNRKGDPQVVSSFKTVFPAVVKEKSQNAVTVVVEPYIIEPTGELACLFKVTKDKNFYRVLLGVKGHFEILQKN
eukprot:TRINITY_DN1389_c0_g1_i2.p1 TRINITY_DN1389_c0_g1~~TRINITY_DN1389_c0_g1_i2.p1  ORF type:complete len:608 (-),score=107.02 TRINITY_DN1389_c0_g1_i2:50-1873(-)